VADEVCVTAVATMRWLGIEDQPLPAALGGGLLTARDPLMTAEVTRRFAEEVQGLERAAPPARLITSAPYY
jgi:hypothetical protein